MKYFYVFISAVILTCIAIYFQVADSNTLWSLSIFSIVIILLMSVIIGYIYFIKTKKRYYLINSMVLFIFIASSMPISRVITNNQMKVSIKNSNVIVQAIERFNHENQRYPNSLFELVPKYLDNIPRTKMFWKGEDYNYYLENDKINLEFRYNGVIGIMYYDFKKGNWYPIPD